MNASRMPVKTITELAQYIRFQLSQLLPQNKHHDFEHLCRHFARLRICGNILPATGPVGAGGDQARDFETYRTYLESTPIAMSTFLGSAKDKKLVFACSLERRIEPKIRSDVSTICSGPEHVDAIYYFCEVHLPIAKRNRLKRWAYASFQVEIEIFDGQALSEQLTDLDVFWIAEEFLDVPAELYPSRGVPTGAYLEFKERWIVKGATPWSYSDFFQIKYGLRRATFNEEAKPDLGKWLKKMEAYLEDERHADLRRRASYEICVANLRGLNNLDDKRDLVEEYFSRISDLESLSDLQDASTLLSYCSSAFLYGHFSIEPEKLFQWTHSLIGRIEQALDNVVGYGAKCRLLEIRGQAGFLQFREGTTPEVSLNEAFKSWSLLLDEVDKAPLFPLEHFADYLTLVTKIAGDNEDFIRLTQRLDELLTNRSSGYVAAEKCRDRAVAYYEAGMYVQAIKQLHQAKIKWFSAEALRGSLLSMLLLSDCYQRLGLVYPAKYYATGVAFLSHQHDDEHIKAFVPKALFALANCCYQAGEWLTFAHMAGLALASHNMYDKFPLDVEQHEGLRRTFAHTAILRTIARRFHQNSAEAFDRVVASWPIDPFTREMLESLSTEHTTYYKELPLDDLWKTVQEQLAGRPFSDVGEVRRISWRALGIRWEVDFANEHLVTCVAEEFVSTLQVILADLANRDLVLLPTSVLIKARILDGRQIEVKSVPSNEVATWRVGFPRAWVKNQAAFDDFRLGIQSLAVTILGSCSMLKHDAFLSEVEHAFAEGLPAKTFAVGPYSELYAEFLPEAEFSSLPCNKLLPLLPSLGFQASEHLQLAWIAEDGPGYSKDLASEFLANRYSQAIKPIRLTLPRLLADDGFRAVLRHLRDDGYLDWEILLMVSNICVDYRVKLQVPVTAPPSAQTRILLGLIGREEKEDDPAIPPSVFTEERIEIQKLVSLGSIANTWGLELHMQTPDFKALETLLDVRYHNSQDDIEHEELFVGV